jgi:hypothetical protein
MTAEPKTESRCDTPAAYRFTWPGRDESYICEAHSHKLEAVANAIGLYLQLIPVEDESGLLCKQVVG